MNKNIVFFLDIDGVLIHSKSPRGYRTFSVDCVQRLKTIVEKYSAMIVISSCWRKNSNWKERLLAAFEKAGWKDPPIIDKTPSSLEGIRGKEIEMWISKNPLDQYIIIDDDSDMLPAQMKKLVRTHGYERGLQDKHLAEIDNILTNEK